MPPSPPTLAEVAALIAECFIADGGAGLRDEDRKKAVEVTAFLDEIARARLPDKAVTLVDAAAGKACVGLLAAKLVLPANSRVITIDRDPARAAAAGDAARRLGIPLTARTGDVADPTLWPRAADLVTALHACGPAADAVLAAAIASEARRILVVPCCTPGDVHVAHLERLGIPRHAPVRRAVAESLLLAERTLRLEAAGYETVVVAFVPPTVTPYNLLFRARRVGEPGRMREAAEQLARLSS